MVEINPKFRHLLMQWSTRGYGRIAVYRVTKNTVRIARVFHTAQDWQKKVTPRRADD